MARRTRSRAAAQQGLARTRTHSATSGTVASRLGRSQYRRRLRLEALEDRRLLAGITVTTLADIVNFNDGVTSLREAIFAANTVSGPDTIEFAPALTANGPATILLTQGELKITDSLSIDGPGAKLLTIDASGNDPTPEVNNGDGSRVFHVNDGMRFHFAEVFLTGLSIVGGDVVGNGGGIFNEEWIVAQDCEFTANSSSTYGGAIYNAGVLSLDGCIVDGNLASLGGGVANFGGVSLVRSVVSNNKAIGDDPVTNAAGGGVFSNGNLGITSSRISDNMTNGSGGGVHAATAHVGVMIRNSVISGNSAGDEGGGLRLVNMVLTLQDSTISGNSAARGGGIHMRGGAATVDSTTITLNQAQVEGGGAWFGGELNPYLFQEVRHAIIAGNSSGGDGAPDLRQQILRGSMNFSHSLVGNAVGSLLAESVGGVPDANGNLIGGPVNGIIDPLLGPLADNGGFELPDGSRVLTHALSSGSLAINAGNLNAKVGDWGVSEFDQRGEPFGRIVGGRIDLGAFEYQTPTDLNLLVDTLVDESDGDYSRGDLSLREAIELANAAKFAGVVDTIRFDPALWAAGPATIVLTATSQVPLNPRILGRSALVITDSLTIDGPGMEFLTIDASGNDPTPDVNNADGSRIFAIEDGNVGKASLVTIVGLTMVGGDAFGDGGAIMSRESLTIRNCRFAENSVKFDSRGDGGAVFVGPSGIAGTGAPIDLRVIGTTFEFNFAIQGGAIAAVNANTFINESFIFANTGSNRGGGAFIYGGEVNVVATHVVENNTGGSGGGVYMDRANARFENSSISKNQSQGYGGAIHGRAGTLDVQSSTINGNRSVLSGGGIAMESGQSKITDSLIQGNSTQADGGAVYGDATITRSEIKENEAKRNGGAIFSRNLTVRQSELTLNAATNDGAGIYLSGGAFQLESSTILGNYAGGRGGGVVLENGSTSIRHSTIAFNSAPMAGGGIFVASDNLTIDHAIIAGNTGSIGPDIARFFGTEINIQWSLVADGKNSGLNEAPVGSPDANGNLVGGAVHGSIDPVIGWLDENEAYVLLPGSPAINAGDPLAVAGVGGVPVHDQRGAPFTRVFGGRIDIGAVEALPVGFLPGDYSGDGIVDAADYSVWRDTTGSASDLRADGNGGGVVDALDYAVWKSNFGAVGEELGAGSGELGGSDVVSEFKARPPAEPGAVGRVSNELLAGSSGQRTRMVERIAGRRVPELVEARRERLLDAWRSMRDRVVDDVAREESGNGELERVAVEAVDFAVVELGRLQLGLGG